MPPLFLLQAAMPVVSVAIAPVNKNMASAAVSTKKELLDEVKTPKVLNEQTYPQFSTRRSTFTELPCTPKESVPQTRFSSQTDLRSMLKDYENNIQHFPLLSQHSQRGMDSKYVPSSLDIEVVSTPKFTSISSNDTFLTANTNTPQENSKYSFHSVMDSSLDSYLTFTLSTPNASPPSLSGGSTESPLKYPLLHNHQLPKSILKKEHYSLPDYAWYSSVSTPDSFHNNGFPQTKENIHEPQGNGYVKKSVVDTQKMDPVDRDRLESVKKIISEKIVNSLGYSNKVYTNSNFDQHRQIYTFCDVAKNKNSILETHL